MKNNHDALHPLLNFNLTTKFANVGFKWHFGYKLSENLKLVKLVIIMVLGSVEEEKTFSTLNFMKSKFYNCCIGHLDLVVRMFAQKNYKLKMFPFYIVIQKWGKEKMRYGN
jgi:hypothetical protein